MGSFWLCEHLGRGHVYGLFTRTGTPLGLMVDPLGSLPLHRDAFVVTPTPGGLSSHSVVHITS
jgi:hypothetical protein